MGQHEKAYEFGVQRVFTTVKGRHASTRPRARQLGDRHNSCSTMDRIQQLFNNLPRGGGAPQQDGASAGAATATTATTAAHPATA